MFFQPILFTHTWLFHRFLIFMSNYNFILLHNQKISRMAIGNVCLTNMTGPGQGSSCVKRWPTALSLIMWINNWIEMELHSIIAQFNVCSEVTACNVIIEIQKEFPGSAVLQEIAKLLRSIPTLRLDQFEDYAHFKTKPTLRLDRHKNYAHFETKPPLNKAHFKTRPTWKLWPH